MDETKITTTTHEGESVIDAAKVGNRNNRTDRATIRAIRKAANDIVGHTLAIEPNDEDVIEQPSEVVEIPILSLDNTVVYAGEAVKATRTDSGVKVGGYLVRYGGQDLEGEHFEADTDFDMEEYGKVTTYFHHGLDPVVGKRKLSRAVINSDQFGIWAETILQERDEYEKFIASLALEGKLGWSSGSVSHLVERDGAKITRWPIAEASLTHTPAEPRNTVTPLKSLIPAANQQAREVAPAVLAVEETNPIVTTSKEVKSMEMTEEQIKALVSDAAKAAVEEYRKSEPAEIKAGGVAVVKDEADQPFSSLGEQLQAVKDFAVSNGRKFDRRLAATKQTGMNEGLGSEGGFLVQQDFSNTLLQPAFQTGILASRVSPITVSANSNGLVFNAVAETSRVTGSRFGGLQAYWLGEGGTKTPTMPALRRERLDLKKLIGLYYATDELLQDASALQSMVANWFRSEFAWMLDNAILNGPGGGQPLGMSVSPALVAAARTLAGTISHEDILAMWTRMVASSRANAIWVYNQDCEAALYSMGLAVGVGGVPSFMPPGGLSGAPYATLMGRPAIPMEQCATLGTQGDIMLIDPTQYIAIDKGGIQSASSIHLAFLTDETAFRFVYRYDGQPTWISAVTPATGSANTLSPYVALAA